MKKKTYARGMTYNEYMRWWRKNKYKFGNKPKGENHWNYKTISCECGGQKMPESDFCKDCI